jgi:hypothetical protein
MHAASRSKFTRFLIVPGKHKKKIAVLVVLVTAAGKISYFIN